jgi:L-ascorbate metabolism protein UlaG (beta-lactamase superfamily)
VSGRTTARRLTWLGQAGFLLEIGGRRILVDPWVTTHELRLVPPPPLEVAADRIGWLLVTHEHLDHLDLPFLPVLAARSPELRVALPEPLVPLVEPLLPAERVVGVSPGDRIELDDVDVLVTPAFHGVSMEDAYGDGSSVGGRPRFVGYVIGAEAGIYHSGDTIMRPELLAAVRGAEIEVALLPINGRDALRESRGIVGNLDAAEAVELALAAGARRLVPHHWDGFDGNTVSPATAVEAAAGRIDVVVPERLVPFELDASRAEAR